MGERRGLGDPSRSAPHAEVSPHGERHGQSRLDPRLGARLARPRPKTTLPHFEVATMIETNSGVPATTKSQSLPASQLSSASPAMLDPVRQEIAATSSTVVVKVG